MTEKFELLQIGNKVSVKHGAGRVVNGKVTKLLCRPGSTEPYTVVLQDIQGGMQVITFSQITAVTPWVNKTSFYR